MIYHWKKRKMKDALYFTRYKIQRAAAYNFFFFFFAYIPQSKDFPLRSLKKKGKKTIYHRNGRREKWKMAFTLLDVKSKELLRIIFSMYAFFYIYFAIERFSSGIFNRRKENYLSSKQKKNGRRPLLYLTRCKI